MIPPAIATFAARIGLTGVAIAVLGTFGVVQTVRIEGFKIWPISIDGYKADLAAAKAALEAQEREYRAAQAEAAERAQQARMAAQERYADIARNADDELEQARRDALADARAFIRANRVSAPGRIRGGGTVATPGDSDPAIALPTDTAPELDAAEFVVVPASDVLICTVNTVALESAQNWAAQLNEATP